MKRLATVSVVAACLLVVACTPSGMSVEVGTAKQALIKAGANTSQGVTCELLSSSSGHVSSSYWSSCKVGADGQKFKVQSWYPHADSPQATAHFTINGRMHETTCYWNKREVNGQVSYSFRYCDAPVRA